MTCVSSVMIVVTVHVIKQCWDFTCEQYIIFDIRNFRNGTSHGCSIDVPSFTVVLRHHVALLGSLAIICSIYVSWWSKSECRSAFFPACLVGAFLHGRKSPLKQSLNSSMSNSCVSPHRRRVLWRFVCSSIHCVIWVVNACLLFSIMGLVSTWEGLLRISVFFLHVCTLVFVLPTMHDLVDCGGPCTITAVSSYLFSFSALICVSMLLCRSDAGSRFMHLHGAIISHSGEACFLWITLLHGRFFVST